MDENTKFRTIRRETQRKYSAEEKIRIVREGLRGEMSVAELCRREGIAKSVYYRWSKEFLEAAKSRLAGDTQRRATSAAGEIGRRCEGADDHPQCPADAAALPNLD